MENIQQEYQKLLEPIRFTNGKETYTYVPHRVPLGGAELALECLAFKQQALANKNRSKSFEDEARSGVAKFKTLCLAHIIRKEISEHNYEPFNEDKVAEVQKFLQSLDDEDIDIKVEQCLYDFFLRRNQLTTFLSALPKDLIAEEKRMSLMQVIAGMSRMSPPPEDLPTKKSSNKMSMKKTS